MYYCTSKLSQQLLFGGSQTISAILPLIIKCHTFLFLYCIWTLQFILCIIPLRSHWTAVSWTLTSYRWALWTSTEVSGCTSWPLSLPGCQESLVWASTKCLSFPEFPQTFSCCLFHHLLPGRRSLGERRCHSLWHPSIMATLSLLMNLVTFRREEAELCMGGWCSVWHG